MTVVKLKSFRDKERSEAAKGLFEMFHFSPISYPKSYDNLVGGSAAQDDRLAAANGLIKIFARAVK